jgi:poly(A) polymerase
MRPAAERLPEQDWMSAPATRAVMAALQAAGGPQAARFVGGCVRDSLLGRPIGDVDIATPLTPDQTMAALAAAGVKVVPTGVEHGAVTAVALGQPFEVTTLRRDVETDGRRAVVAFSTDWAEDARRRDFRLNALYMDEAGTLYDPVGHGIEDARAGRVVFVGDPDTRIREDYLRILRFFRFGAWFGRGPADAAGLEACRRHVDGLGRLSAERISKELLKLLAAEDPCPALAAMADVGALTAILPETGSLALIEALVEIDRAEAMSADPELRLAALLPRDPSAAAAAAERLRLSGAQRARLIAAASIDPAIVADMAPVLVRRRLYESGPGPFGDRARLAWAAAGGAAGSWLALLRAAEAWRRPRFPLSGEDAAAAGLRPGPEMGQALRAAETWWVEQDFRPDRAALTARLKAR